MKNDHLISYYTKILNLQPRDMQDFINIMAKPLPQVIRVCKGTQYFDQIAKLVVKMGFKKMADNIFICEEIEGYRKVDRNKRKMDKICTEENENDPVKNSVENIIKTNQNAESKDIENITFEKNRKFLNILTDLNLITNQELVSMLPSSFIITLKADKEKFTVLDLCAAPGSKTTHLLENDLTVTANDSNLKRCFVMQNRTANWPKLLTNTNGLNFPKCKNLYDAVLVDAPCSGDGTFRKNKIRNIASKNVELMKKLLIKGLGMVKEGGMVIYSTCAMDPIENEWVVQDLENAEIINVDEIGNAIFEILKTNHFGRENKINNDTSEKSRIFYREGLTDWTTDTKFKSNNNTELKNCMRFYPQDNNSGAFFIALLRKKKVKEQFVSKTEKNNFDEVNENYFPMIDGLLINKSFYTSVDAPLIQKLLAFFHLKLEGFFLTTSTKNKIYFFKDHDHLEIARKTNVLSIGMLLFTKLRGEEYRIHNLAYFKDFVLKCYEVEETLFKKMLNNEKIFEDDPKELIGFSLGKGSVENDHQEGIEKFVSGFKIVKFENFYYSVLFSKRKVEMYISKEEREIIRTIIKENRTPQLFQ